MPPKQNEEMVTITLPRSVFEILSQAIQQFMPLLEQAALEEQAGAGGAMNPQEQALQDEMIAAQAAQQGR
jgi:hypothetical protein